MKFYLLLPLLLLINCQATESEQNLKQSSGLVPQAYHPSKEFNDYWYEGKAELTSYDLKQARYGEIREGKATFIFVTEHLDPESLVKTTTNTEQAVPIIKHNFTRKFMTGIYPYSVMSSIFTPVNRNKNPHTAKVTFSAQEWCGHVFQMAKLEEDHYNIQLNSYFQGEADQQFTREAHLLEDELWNLIRINPDSLPTGQIQLIPSFTHIRLAHIELKPATARATLGSENDSLAKYTVEYKNLDRKLEIYFEQEFPHSIAKWKEEVKSGFGENAKTLTTTAVRKKTILLDYWNKNAVADSVYRDQLGY